MKNLNVTLKVVLSLLLILCLVKMPYGYYQLTRFAAFIGFAYLAYNSFEKNLKVFAFIYICLALLFQPFSKLALGRELWNAVDVVVSIGLIISIFIKKDN